MPGAPPVAPTPALPLPLPVAAVEAADDDDAADAKELRGHVEGAPSGLPRDRADAGIPASSSSVLTLLPQSLRPLPNPSSSLSRRPWAGPRAEDAAMGPSTTDQRTTVMTPSVASSATSIPPDASIHTRTGAPFSPPTHPAAAASATGTSAMRVAVVLSPMERQRQDEALPWAPPPPKSDGVRTAGTGGCDEQRLPACRRVGVQCVLTPPRQWCLRTTSRQGVQQQRRGEAGARAGATCAGTLQRPHHTPERRRADGAPTARAGRGNGGGGTRARSSPPTAPGTKWKRPPPQTRARRPRPAAWRRGRPTAHVAAGAQRRRQRHTYSTPGGSAAHAAARRANGSWARGGGARNAARSRCQPAPPPSVAVPRWPWRPTVPLLVGAHHAETRTRGAAAAATAAPSIEKMGPASSNFKGSMRTRSRRGRTGRNWVAGVHSGDERSKWTAPARTGTSDRHDGPPVCRQRWRTRGRGGAAAAVALAACATDPDRPPNLTAGSVAKRVRTGHQRCRLCRFGVVRCPALLSARGPRQLIHCRWSSIVEFMVPVLYIQLIPLGQIVPFLERDGQVPTVLCFGLCCRATTARAFHAACSALSPPSPDGCSVAVPGDSPGTENCRHPWGIAARPAVRAP